MTRKSYSDLLKDPRWQRKRLEILQLSDFKCECCESGEKTLHVHHKIYRKGTMPWDYEDHELQALCEDCHAAEHQIRSELAEMMAVMEAGQLEQLLGYAQGMLLMDGTIEPVKPKSFEHVLGMSNCATPNDCMEIDRVLLSDAATGGKIGGLRLHDLYDARRDALEK